MADSDFLSYSSIYDSFSKGPKSIYYGIGDEMLPGAVLNVPQTDDDDEWGRTQRISDERSYDFIAKIYKTLFDPYNAISDITFVPGEAGSEINVAKNMIRLVGRSGIDVGIFDITDKTMTLEDVIIDGLNNKITIGSGFEADEENIKIGNSTNLNGDTDTSTYSFKSKNSISFNNDDTNPVYTTITVNGKSYRFDESALTLPVGTSLSAANITASGDIVSYNIIPATDDLYDIGTTLKRYKAIYSVTSTSGNFISSNFGSSDIATTLCGTTVTFKSGSDGVIFDAGAIYPTGTTVNITLGTLTNRFNNLFSKLGNFSSTLTTSSLVPSSDNTADIGTTLIKYKDIYAYTGYYSDHIDAPSICYSGTLRAYSSIFTIYSYGNQVGSFDGSSFTVSTRILPNLTNTQDLGGSSNIFRNIYANTGVFTTSVTSGLYIGANFGDNSVAVTLCGTSVSLYDTIDGVGGTKLNFSNSSFSPSRNEYISLGTSLLNYNIIYAKTGEFSGNVKANYFNGSNFGNSGSSVTLCGGTTVTLKADTPNFSVSLDSDGFRPGFGGLVSLGSNGRAYKELWLIDELTTASRRVYVCNGFILVQ